jgi:hypothetical protein
MTKAKRPEQFAPAAGPAQYVANQPSFGWFGFALGWRSACRRRSLG